MNIDGVPRRLVVGVTGASGVPYALDLMRTLAGLPLETELVVSAGAARVIAEETDLKLADLATLATRRHDDRDVGAGIASGSYRTVGMVVVPCSASTLAKIAAGIADSLITRAAHVHLKERRPLVLVPREAPYSRPMLTAMLAAFDAGARIIPASPGFYHRPRGVDDLLGFVTARVLDQLGVEHDRSRRWKEGE
ncbi:MAG TPA: UbiX family flavin prenyltransferase [Deinococcales bacterium]|nr:UbiX family flavin prenyltransferase [Deinococcales bacterium]